MVDIFKMRPASFSKKHWPKPRNAAEDIAIAWRWLVLRLFGIKIKKRNW